METIKLLNVQISNVSLSEILEKIEAGGVLYTPNVDHLVRLQKDPNFYQIYMEADYRICDSQIMYYASRFLGSPIREKIAGSDFFPAFYRYYQHDENIRIFLLGSRAGVAQKAQEIINRKLGRNIIVGAHSPSFGFENYQDECQRLVELINRSDATVLAVGVGSPKQEKWIHQYKSQLKHIKIFMAIGATIDFEAGLVPRAPRLMSDSGLEWLYRLISEPKRLWKRYLVDDLLFFWLILKQRTNRYRNPFPEKVTPAATVKQVNPSHDQEQKSWNKQDLSQVES